jgi:replicative DNA helicase
MDDAPHNLDFERALLAAVIKDNAVLDQIGVLDAAAFYDAQHQQVFELMQGLRAEGRAVNVVTLGGLIGADPLGGVGIIEALKAVAFGDVTPKPYDLGEEIRDLALRRAMLAQGKWLMEQAPSRHVKRADILSTHLGEIDALIAKGRARAQTTLDIADAMAAAQDFFQASDGRDSITTGLASVDKMTGGFGREDLIILAGRPSMGKSALAVNFGTYAAVPGHGVLIFTLEMSLEAWMARMSSEASWNGPGTGIPYVRGVRQNLATGKELDGFVRAGMAAKKLPIKIVAQTDLSAAEIAARTRRAAADFERAGKRLGLVIVDHIGKVKPSKHYRGNRVMEIGEITNAMKNLAMSEKIAVLALHQLNRSTEARDNKRPALSDLRDSGNVEQDADTILLVYRPAYYLERAREDKDSPAEIARQAALAACRCDLEVTIAKQRNGEVGTVDLFCDMPFNVIRDLDRRRT